MYLDHRDLYVIWSSWRFTVTEEETVAVPIQICRWIIILAWHGIEKEVTDQRPLESRARNFEEWYRIA